MTCAWSQVPPYCHMNTCCWVWNWRWTGIVKQVHWRGRGNSETDIRDSGYYLSEEAKESRWWVWRSFKI